MTTVFVSSANGYIAEHVIKQLIEKEYKVVGSVRSTEKGETLKRQLNSKNFQYEIVSDIGADNAFDAALKNHPEVTVFIHSASPVLIKSEDPEKDIVQPAIKGVKNAFCATKAHAPQIKKVVLTSSIAAVLSMEIYSNPNSVFNEDSWSPMSWEDSLSNSLFAYMGSKTFAEKAAWEFVKNEEPNFTLNAINPYLVIGPEAFDLEGRTKLKSTADRLNELINGGNNESNVKTQALGYVDVRDVARAHIHAFESDVINFRYVLSEAIKTQKDMLDILNKEFPQLKGKVPVGYGVDEACKAVKAAHGKLDDSRTRKLLGFEFISFEQSIIDSAKQILN